MANPHEELAQRVVMTFKHRLSPQARNEIRDAQFDELTAMIGEVISQELRGAAEIVEAAAKKLRADIEQRELGL
jgi:hypothetical protein